MDATLTETPKTRFFTRMDWSAFWTSFIVSFAVYTYTLAPTVSLEDSGELATAAAHLGVPHPPGYPIWTLLCWIFTRLFSFVTYLGQPNPAWSVALCSAFFGALAIGITAMLVSRSGADMLRTVKRTTEAIGETAEGWISWCGGVVSSLLFAFSQVMWSQAVIVEVYALNAFFLMLVMLLTYMWVRRPSDKLLYVTALIFGLGLTNYQVLLLLFACLVLVIVFKDLALFRDFMIGGVPYLAVVYMVYHWGPIYPNGPAPVMNSPSDMLRSLLQHGMLPPIIHPTHFTFFIYLFLDLLGMLLIYFLLPRGRAVAITMLCVQAGVAFYAAMPIASEFNPPMNWGYPRTWEGFKHALTRGQYEKISPTSIFSPSFIQQVGEYLGDLRNQFTLPLAVLGFLPFTAFGFTSKTIRFRFLLVTVLLVAGITALVLIEEYIPAGMGEALYMTPIYRLATGLILLILAVGGIMLGIGEIHELVEKLTGRRPAHLSERMVVFCVLAGVAAFAVLYIKTLLGIAFPMSPTPFAPGPIVPFAHRLTAILFIFAPAACIAFLYWAMYGVKWIEMDVDSDSRKWIITTLAGFLVMSVALIVLADPKGDIQDQFIQRVKFISSHGLYSLWIGYGIIFGLGLIDTYLPHRRWVVITGIVIALGCTAVPVYRNYTDPEIERIVGGAEQNLHDYGWQFGNYQLRGAAAIAEELSPAEEPLPNPSYPEEMGPNAVFFGGTDPGRFVPTYMIYSAVVRPDVFLITQNALADNTYMSVMRDLYGDAIWIPSVVDGNQAFQKYVEDVNAGRIPANAAISIENGRVSVQGVAGVMLINGILAQMIFDYNKWRHNFYVEESYVIQWMYPYLTPHGLIMKINADSLPALTPEMVRNDLDFWDWYTRRLTGDRQFVRDIVGRKSFSKLRSAIGGLYVYRNMLPEAEQAFKESFALYPLSPEANFRLADLYMRWNRFADAITLMSAFAAEDPHNARAREFVNDLKNREHLIARARELETLLGSSKGSVVQALELAGIYRQLGQDGAFLNLANSIINNPNMPPDIYRKLAAMLAESRKMPEAIKALQLYLDKVPADMKGWIDMAAYRLTGGKADECVQSMIQAIKVGGEEAKFALRQDARFTPIRNTPLFQSLTAQQESRFPL
jgi:tetratricopeptide (TPR) repeat protein